MQCRACGEDNREGRRFCGQCGAELVVACPACGAPNEPGDRFCGACGEPLTTAPPVPAAATERRLVSVLFADLVGFTSHSDARDPEEVRELLTGYFDAARAAVQRHGGVVEKFIGDAVMAVWGARAAQEDDAERAVRVALELIDSVHALGERTGLVLQARAGVATGEAAVSVGAIGQGIVAGDLVNTASRIQAAAAPGAVFVDETTRRMTEAAIVCEPAGSFELKGKRDPMPLWRAARVSAARRGVGRSAGLDPPFVGRERELRLLKDLFHATEGGRAHLVGVTGIAGIGKSRLAWEFEKYADGLADEVLWHRGRCLSYGDGVAFWALAEMVRMRARITEDEPAATAEPKLAAVVEEWVTDPDDREWVMPPLLHLLGLAQIADGDRERLFPAWRRFFEAMAERLPVVLVFEDMQWADEALLSFVEYLMEWSRDHGLFVVALARPELADRRPGWGATSRSLTSLTLEPLSGAAMVELVSGMVPGLPAEAAARIAAAAEGVPLYAVETARMLLDRGLLVRAADGGGYGVTGDIADIEIPETLHALVAARLDGLSEDERRLLQQAAVLGKSFAPDGLAAVSGQPRDQIDGALAALARKELISVQTDPRSPERGQYGFVQDMVRTIARDTLGRRERKRLHLATAEHLRRQGGDELAEVIAAHRVDAYRLLPDDPDAVELRDGARSDILRAADRAASLAAPAEAFRLVIAALDLVPDGPEQAQLHERAGALALQKGDVAEAERQFTQALGIHEGAGDSHSAARVRARRGDVLFLEGRAEQAVLEMEEAYAVLADGPPDADLAHLGAQLGRLCGMIGDEARGRAALEQAIEIAETQRLPEVLSNALNTKGLWIIAFTNRREEGRSLLLGALRVALDADETQAAMRAYFNLSFEREGVDDDSHTYDQDGLALAERIGDEQWKRSFLLHTSHAALERGDWDEAVRITREAEETPESDIFARAILLTRGVVLARRGDVAGAREAIEAAGFDESVSDEQNRAMLWAARAEVLAAEGRYAEAAAAAERGAGSAQTLWLGHPAIKAAIMVGTWCAVRAGDRAPAQAMVERLAHEPLAELAPRLYAHRALLRAMLADPGQAAGLYAEAVRSARATGSPWRLALALAEQANADMDADAALAELTAILERLGAQAALERLVPDASPARAAAAT